MKDSSYNIKDVIRQYNHLLSRGETVDDVIRLMERIFGESFTDVFSEYGSIREFQEASGHDTTLLEKLRDCLPLEAIDESLLVFHYRSMLFSIQQATESAQTKVRGTMAYVQAIAAVALALFVFSEFFIQPTMMDIFESFRAPVPGGWALTHAITLAFLPIVIGWIALTRWLLGSAGDMARYFRIAASQRRYPILSAIGDAFRSYVVASFVRYAGSLKIDSERALDAVRQAVAISFDDIPDNQNIRVLDRVVNNLSSAEQLGTFTDELAFWENESKADVARRIEALSGSLEAIHMALMGVFVGCIIIQMYLWIFSMGAAFA